MGAIPDNDGIHKRRGVWYYRLRIDGRLRELSTRSRNYQEARRIRQEVVEAHRKGQLPTDLARCPFDRVAEDWLAGRKVRVSAKTYSSDTERLRPLRKAFGSCRLEELVVNGGALIRAYQLRRSSRIRACNMELTIIRQILKLARLWRRVEDDVRSLPERSRGPGRALTADEESRLWAMASSRPDWQVPYLCGMLAANTTMRSCEIKGLRLMDVDLNARLLNIRRTKTDAGVRMIPLNTTAHWALTQLVARAKRLGSTLPEHYLLPRRLATRTYDPTQHQLSWRSAWRRLTKAAGQRGLRFHDLRHHSITRLAEAGVPEQTLMAIAGHVSRKMLEHYSHIRVQAKRDAVLLLEPKPAELTNPTVAPAVPPVIQ
jgi:integrase